MRGTHAFNAHTTHYYLTDTNATNFTEASTTISSCSIIRRNSLEKRGFCNLTTLRLSHVGMDPHKESSHLLTMETFLPSRTIIPGPNAAPMRI